MVLQDLQAVTSWRDPLKSDLFGAELMTCKWGINFGHFEEAGVHTYLDRPRGAEWMIRGAEKHHPPSLRVQTAPFGRCWYIHILFFIHISGEIQTSSI